jgi:hypothetical protein
MPQEGKDRPQVNKTTKRKVNDMKTILISAIALALTALVLQASSLNTVEVSAPAIHCIFNPACTNLTEESTSPIALPGTTGSGFLQTRVILGETNSMAAGLFGYEYRVDLSGIVTDTNHPVCLTNIIRCSTNRVEVRATNVVCRTNRVGVLKAVTCITNYLPATNLIVWLTNAIPGTNVQRCFTNSTGAIVCFTNVFPGTNVVLCITNRVPPRTIIACQTNIIDPGREIVLCFTNRVRYHTNVVTCRTNITTCPGSPPCIKSLRIKFGAPWPFDFNQDGTNDQVYVVSSGGAGTVHPASIKRDGKKIEFRFSPPLCAGEASVFVGLLSPLPPRDVDARITLTAGSKLTAATRAPGHSRLADCDFDKLSNEIKDLHTRDLLGSNDQEREARRSALLSYVDAAGLAAQADNLDVVLANLAQITIRVDGGANDWLTQDAAHDVDERLEDLLECLEDASGRDLDDDHDGDNDHDDHDDD